MSMNVWIVVTALYLATVATIDAIVDVIYYVYKIDCYGMVGMVGANEVAIGKDVNYVLVVTVGVGYVVEGID